MKFLTLFLLLISCGSLPAEEEKPPQDPDGLHSWLARGAYKDWISEENVKTGLNGSPRRLFVNEKLYLGLQNESQHEVGSVAIREMYEKNGVDMRGISFMEKREIDGEGKWFYYETLNLVEKEHHFIGVELSACQSCHPVERDFIHSQASTFLSD